MLLCSRREFAVAWLASGPVPLAGRAADVRYDVSIAGRPLDSTAPLDSLPLSLGVATPATLPAAF